MSNINVKPENVRENAAAIRLLSEKFSSTIDCCMDDSRGPGMTALYDCVTSLRKVKQALKNLMVETSSYLDEVGIRFQETDMSQTESFLKNYGIEVKK